MGGQAAKLGARRQKEEGITGVVAKLKYERCPRMSEQILVSMGRKSVTFLPRLGRCEKSSNRNRASPTYQPDPLKGGLRGMGPKRCGHNRLEIYTNNKLN